LAELTRSLFNFSRQSQSLTLLLPAMNFRKEFLPLQPFSGIDMEDIKLPLSNNPQTAAFCDKLPQGVFPPQPFEIKPLSVCSYFFLLQKFFFLYISINLYVYIKKFLCTYNQIYMYI
jgi:hypothetical protein